MTDELAESKIEAFQLKLGKGDYEKTITLSDLMKKRQLTHIDVLILDLNQREWQVIDKIIEDGLLSKVCFDCSIELEFELDIVYGDRT